MTEDASDERATLVRLTEAGASSVPTGHRAGLHAFEQSIGELVGDEVEALVVAAVPVCSPSRAPQA
ncbi:hypothetical protein [Streptomyces sp. NPDC020597]|uniref:hypothetical protein n=1 Tax=unclassified Streptomyces TaxID=2593676 RepID=UPI00378AA02A